MRGRFGGPDGNEILTSTAAVLLIALLAVEGVTLLMLDQLLSVHMFVGLALVPPVLLKLASTGYRFARYYMRTRAYRDKGPPHIVLRVLAPILVVATLTLLGSGIWLLLVGHRSDAVLRVHQIAFIVWSAVFVIHFLAHAPRMARSLGRAWRARMRQPAPGARVAATLMCLALVAGAGLGLLGLSRINAWHGRDRGGERDGEGSRTPPPSTRSPGSLQRDRA